MIENVLTHCICELSKRAILLSLERKADEEDLHNALAELILGDESMNTSTYQPENQRYLVLT